MVVLCNHFLHPLQVSMDLFALVNVFDDSVTFSLHFVEAPLKLSNQFFHLVLILLLLCKLTVKNLLALGQLFNIFIQIRDLSLQVCALTSDLCTLELLGFDSLV